MRRTLVVSLAIALALSACDSRNTVTDASAEDAGSADAGSPPLPDAGSPGDDAGPPVPTCTEGCEFVELALGTEHTCARRANGQVWCWGRNEEGELGDGRMRHQDCSTPGSPEVDCSSDPVQVRAEGSGLGALITDAVQLSSQGTFSTCAVRGSGGIWCWGEQGTPTPGGSMPSLRFRAVPIAGLESATQVANGHHHLCGLVGENAICFGYNGSGQVGLGHKENVPMPAGPVLDAEGIDPLSGVVQIATTGRRGVTCARTASQVLCWGNDFAGQLGDGPSAPEECGSIQMDQYRCSSLPRVVGGSDAPLPPGTELVAGLSHQCVLGATAPGSLHCWGDNEGGQLGAGPEIDSAHLPHEVTLLTDVLEDEEVVEQVALGGHFTCVRTSTGAVWCWGYNYYGQLGDGADDHGEPGASDNCTPGTDNGDCSHVPVRVQGIDDATAIGAGSSHACAIRASGQIWCWGYNNNRQLGDGTRDTRTTPVRVLRLPN